MSSVKPPPTPSTVASEVPPDLVAIAGEFKAGLVAARALKSAQIGFKDFRLGVSVKTDGKPKDTTNCKVLENFPSGAMPGVSEETLKTLRARWWLATSGDMKECTATTTVLDKPAAVTYYTVSTDDVIVKIVLKAATADVLDIAAVLSKTLGAPKEENKTTSGKELREVVHKAQQAVCDNPGIPMPPQDLQKCYSTVDYRTDLQLQMLPAAIVVAKREWVLEGAYVGYMAVNTIDPTEISFFATP
jgi:hypothetical protein